MPMGGCGRLERLSGQAWLGLAELLDLKILSLVLPNTSFRRSVIRITTKH